MTRDRKSRMEAGFSLLEMLVGLAIIAVLLALSVPRFDRPAGAIEIRSFAITLASDLRATRAMAISRGQTVDVEFDIEARRYRVLNVRSIWQPVPPKLTLLFETARQVTRLDGGPVIRFFADGTSTGGTVNLVAGDRRIGVRVEWLTGTAETLEGTGG
jgi:general secretion pathway protein H